MVTEKVCGQCRQLKSAEEFYVNKRKTDGLSSWCKPCQRLYQRGELKVTTRVKSGSGDPVSKVPIGQVPRDHILAAVDEACLRARAQLKIMDRIRAAAERERRLMSLPSPAR